jgi:16S rRNA (cytosine1402-N4)-methyltransferase
VALAARIGPTGERIGIDRDPEAGRHFDALRAAMPCPARLVRADFASGLQDLAASGAKSDVILMDLGLSSMQVDTAERGFSYSRQAPLDMRMDPALEVTAADLVNGASESDLTRWFREYGEERYAKQIARAIVRRRDEQPITTTGELVEVIRSAVPTPALFAGGHPAKRVFQALRIEVNDEFGVLDALLRQIPGALRSGGRVALLTFHSGEDRRVKKAFERGLADGTYAEVSDEVVRPSPEERRENPRSAPAKLRWARRA